MCRKMERPRGFHREANFSGTRGHVGSVLGGVDGRNVPRSKCTLVAMYRSPSRNVPGP